MGSLLKDPLNSNNWAAGHAISLLLDQSARRVQPAGIAQQWDTLPNTDEDDPVNVECEEFRFNILLQQKCLINVEQSWQLKPGL